MKQLKFMLAAATALSLATASQAADPISVNFNTWKEGALVPMEDANGFSYEATDGANTSVVAKKAEGDLMLNVATDKNPLLFNLKGTVDATGYDLSDSSENLKSVVIESDVKFTVTPVGETITVGDNDKLLIYLQAVEVDSVTVNKLMVKALEYQPGGRDGEDNEIPETKNPVACEVCYADDSSDVAVNTEDYYALKVKSVLVGDVPMFELYLGNRKLAPKGITLNKNGVSIDERCYFPSLQAAVSKTLTYVGFAGEGYVDNIAVSTESNTPSSVDFTFTLAWDADAFSSVTYTIDGVAGDAAVNGGSFTVPDSKKLVIAYELNEWYKISGSPVLEYTAAVNGTGSLTLKAEVITMKEDGDNVVVKPGTSASAVGITAEVFADADATKLGEVLTWAKKGSVTTAQINNMTFTSAGDPAGDTDEKKLVEEAYLLNCSPAEVGNKKDAFKITANDLAKLLTSGDLTELDVDNGLYNGKVIIEGRNDLGTGTWEITEQGNSHKFYRARLVFPTEAK